MRLRAFPHLLVHFLALLVLGCTGNTGSEPAEGNADAGQELPEAADAAPSEPGPSDDQLPDPDPAPGTCADEHHLCGDTCVDDQYNIPEDGCQLGCGAPCQAPEYGIASCSEEGLCDFWCDYGVKYDGQCVFDLCEASGAVCGDLIDERGQSHDCGHCFGTSTCGADQRCEITEDAAEPNEGPLDMHDFGALVEFPDTELRLEGLNIHAETDEDWFTFRAVDGFEPGNPSIAVVLYKPGTLTGWLSAKHELSAWFQCDTVEDETEVTCEEWFQSDGVSDDTHGPGCRVTTQYRPSVRIQPDCESTDDSGTVIVRVRNASALRGADYSIGVFVE